MEQNDGLHQIECEVTKTTSATANIINENLHKSPLYKEIFLGLDLATAQA